MTETESQTTDESTGGDRIRLVYPPEVADGVAMDLDDARSRRAVEEPMVAIPRTTRDGTTRDAYRVVTLGGEYEVALENRPYCTCPDEEHNSPDGPGCKHRRRVILLAERGDLPTPGQDAQGYVRRLRALRERLTTKQHIAAVEAVEADHDLEEAEALAKVERFDHFIDAV